MNKQAYQQPRLHTVNIHMESLLQTASATGVNSNADFNSTIQGGSGPGRGRESSGWFDDDEE